MKCSSTSSPASFPPQRDCFFLLYTPAVHADKRTELLHLAPSLIFTHLFFFTPLSKLSTKKTLQLCPPSLLPVKLAVNEAGVQRFDLQDCYLIFFYYFILVGALLQLTAARREEECTARGF